MLISSEIKQVCPSYTCMLGPIPKQLQERVNTVMKELWIGCDK